ncbi:TonB-dependent receptor [uncultured Arcticibacterium sp.]|uniref:TonB-dependent receptor n=1 Tax=uncultured Arcticibacterium sp. TaxID=2173042 RepID=UPI0030F8243A
MKKLYTLLLLLITLPVLSQTIISGKVSDKKGEALPFANISLEGTYDGGSSDIDGNFNFSTEEKGEHILQISMIGYKTLKENITISDTELTFDLKLTESINSLNAVVVTAGMFEASDEKKMVMLKPMDIVTTAGAGADIVSVMQFLPGANRVGETEGLFVRGGSANETKTVIDGMIVQNPFFSSTPDVPQRGRFNPFMFKGTAFSTGGYSAMYGQALSSVLLLNTQDKQGDNSNINLGLNMAGATASYTHKGWITGTVNYTNLSPLLNLVKTNIDFEKVPQGFGTSLTINENFDNNSSLKVYGTYTDNSSALVLPTYDEQNGTYLFENNNVNTFSNASYRRSFDEGNWVMQAGLSYSNNKDNLLIDDINSDRNDKRTQARMVWSRLFGEEQSSSFNFGAEYHNIKLSNLYGENELNLDDKFTSIFAESEFYITSKLAGRLGLRTEHSSIIGEMNLAPRVSLAYKAGKYAQFSLAAGRFYQNPDKEYLYINQNLGYENADHVILNYQVKKNDRTFRTEVFYKKYNNLVSEETESFDPNPYRFPTGLTDNSGKGYAQGFDVFFRDQKSLKSGDFWLTYSYLDTERQFKNYSSQVLPSFASKHNFSAIYKQFFDAIATNIGVTFTHTSGRPIYTINEDFKNVEYTKAFQNLSLSASHVKQFGNQFVVFYATLDNVLGRNNIFGYRYSTDGKERYAVKPTSNRSFFFGINWTIGQLNGRSKEADLNF